MKQFLRALSAAMVFCFSAGSQSADLSTNKLSFTNLQGIAFVNVTPVRTNKDNFVFKREGLTGFVTEKLTNLPNKLQWEMRSPERAVEALRVARDRDLSSAILSDDCDKCEKGLIRRRAQNKSLLEKASLEKWEINDALSSVHYWTRFVSDALLEASRSGDTNASKRLKDCGEGFRLLEQDIQNRKNQISKLEADALAAERRAEEEIERKAAAKRQAEKEIERKAAEEREWVIASTLPKSDLRSLYPIVTNAVTSQLRAPRTAVYDGPEHFKFEERKGARRVVGYVDSQNSFGALVRTQFKVEISKVGGEWKAINTHFPEQKELEEILKTLLK
jgi:hypothetical protein